MSSDLTISGRPAAKQDNGSDTSPPNITKNANDQLGTVPGKV